MNQFIKATIITVVVSFLLNSCTTKKQIVYVQDIQEQLPVLNDNYSVTIKPDDLLRITVSSFDMEAAKPFNKFLPSVSQNGSSINGQQTLDSYLVKADGTINLPKLGAVDVNGKTLQELSVILEEQLTRYLKGPDVEVRLLNFKYTVLGEVKRPGTFNFNDNRITLIQALGYAGDMTIDGKRDNVTIIRDNSGVQEFLTVDLTSADFITSKAYYLQQNDTVIVQPNSAKASTGGYYRYTGTIVSIASLLLSVTILLTRN